MCVVLIIRCIDGPEQSQSWWCKNTHRTQCHTHHLSKRLQASNIILPDGEKQASTICVVLIARYLDSPEESQFWWCEKTHHNQHHTHQHSPRLQASIIMLPDGEQDPSKISFSNYAIYRRPGLVTRLVVQEHSSYPWLEK